MNIIEERAKRTSDFGFDAEVVVTDDTGKYFIHANSSSELHYTVASKSMFDFTTAEGFDEDFSIEFIEEYDDVEDAEESKFYEAIKVADRLLDDISTELE